MAVLLGLGLVVLATGMATSALDDALASAASDANSTVGPGPSRQPTPSRSTQQPTKRPTPQPTPTAKQPTYQNDDYQAKPPPNNPPPVPYPRTDAQARTWLVRNSLYGQVAPRPIRCTLNRVKPKTASRAQLERYLNELSACLMKEWDGVLTRAGYLAVRPRIVVYTGPIQTQCGLVSSGSAFYCSADQRVYFPTTFYQYEAPETANALLPMLTVMAHEFGHVIQGRVGIILARNILVSKLPKNQALEYTRRTELQADCLAGRFVGSLSTYLGVSEKDRALLKQSWAGGGDDRQSSDPDHGLSTTRISWLFTGIDKPGKLSVCNTWTAPSDKVR